MKVGSIVECVDNSNLIKVRPLKLKAQYTVRAIVFNRKSSLGPKYTTGILLEEIINDKALNGLEHAYIIDRFREVEFPDDLMEQVGECLTKDLELV